MKIAEINSKTILCASQVYDYVVNPYVGCQHGCTYCYARFMKRFTGHKEPWGDFVDVKINAPDVLRMEIQKKKKGVVWVSGVCDPYQPLEKKYELTRRCLEILIKNNWPIIIQTRSSLVLRDMDLLKEAEHLQVGLSITTANDEIRKIFEPHAPAISDRLSTIEALHQNGIKTYVMIAPMLPEAENLIALIDGKVDYIIVDRMNYHYADWVYAKNNLEAKRTDAFFRETREKIVNECRIHGIDCQSVF